jgi:asparagine synthase (glutamine-hydrolysing)
LDSYNKPKLKIADDDAVLETENILTESFNYRMVADVPVGIFLSGGFDSSAVACLLQKDRTEKLKTFTIGFDVEGFDEAPHARKIADHLGTDHTEYYCSPTDALSIIPDLPEIYDEPFADNSTVPTVLVSQLARKSVTVALSGDGGDEIFAGYDKFNRSLSYAGGWPAAKRFVSEVMDWINPDWIPVLRSRYNFSTRFEKTKLILASNNSAEILKLISQHIPHTEVKKIVKLPFDDYATQFDLNGLLVNDDPLAKLLAIDYITFLTDNNLVKMDRATMSVALEGREPFLDQSVIEFVARLPSDLKIRDGINKYVLKEIVYKYLPKDLMDRPKKPFLAPLSVWFMEKLKEFFLHYLDEERIRKEGYFNPEPIIQMRDQFLGGKPIKHQKLWNILIFEMWYERWMK